MASETQAPYLYRKEVSLLEGCDVAIAGGGIAGVFAALAASRRGASTVLIERHSFVGGQATAGGVHTFCGESRLVNDAWREMVLRLERYDAIAAYRPNDDGRLFDVEMLKLVLQEMLTEAEVRLLLHTQVVDIERNNDAIASLIVFNKSGLQRLACRQAIDATGDADIVAIGGWPYEKGGPVFLPTGELDDASEDTHLQLPMSLYFTMVRKSDNVVLPVLPVGSATYETDDDLPMITVHDHGNLVVVKMKVIGHDATDGESLSQAEQAGRRQMMAVIHHLQTKGYKGRSYPDYKLAWVAPQIGIREGRRVIAQYRLTADDVLNGRHFDDAVAVGSYHVDYHWPTVVQRAGTGLTTQVPPYQIPLRALRPAGSENLLVPGRGISGDQMAMSSFRVMGICAQTGFAAGTAAALAAKDEQRLDDLSAGMLQTQLRHDGVRLDLAPYGNYLRVRRMIEEPVFTSTDQFAECHASTLVQLPDGDFICAWFGGTAEGAEDVDIWLSRRHEEEWSRPIKVVGVPGTPMWNPVLFLDDTSRLSAEASVTEATDGAHPRLLMYYRVGREITQWRSYVIESRDGGRTWSEPTPLPDGLLGPIRNKPIVLSDGTWLAGSSVETEDEWYCQVERSEDQGGSWRAMTLKLEGHPKGIIQPTLWESEPGQVHALFRSRGVGHICRSDSMDGGRSWTPVYRTDLPNNNSGIDVAKIVPAPGDPGYDAGPAPLVLAFNPVTVEDWDKRTPLVLAVSYDNGQTWPERKTLEDGPGEYSYPAVIATSDGVAVSYTFDRKHIQFGRFSLEQLTGANLDPFSHIGDHAEHAGWIEQFMRIDG